MEADDSPSQAQVEDFQPSNTGKFAPRHDIMLLEQVTLARPWEAEHGKLMAAWDDVAVCLANSSTFGLNKKGISLKSRFEVLMAKFKKGEKISLRMSGTTEDYDKREMLLTDIKTRMDDYTQLGSKMRDSNKRKQEAVENSGSLLRQMALAEIVAQDVRDEGAQRKKQKRQSAAPIASALLESIQGAIEEKKQRDARAEALQIERLAFDREEARRQAKQHEENQQVLVNLLEFLVKK
ncbi:unnamed protein product [Aphanomyces euteiches]